MILARLVSLALITTSSSLALSLLTRRPPVSPRELVTLPLSVGVGTSPDFVPDGYHVAAALEDGWDACGCARRWISIAVTARRESGWCVCASMALRAIRRSTAVAGDFVQSNSGLLSHCALGALCTGACGAW